MNGNEKKKPIFARLAVQRNAEKFTNLKSYNRKVESFKMNSLSYSCKKRK